MILLLLGLLSTRVGLLELEVELPFILLPKEDICTSSSTSHLDSERVTPLHMAAQEGHLEVVQYLTLEQHCDPLCVAKNNNTPFHAAAYFGHLQLVRFFVEVLHCPPDIRGGLNMTPLEQAHSQGHRHVVQYLESIHPKLQ